jgi:hypothetical protein
VRGRPSTSSPLSTGTCPPTDHQPELTGAVAEPLGRCACVRMHSPPVRHWLDPLANGRRPTCFFQLLAGGPHTHSMHPHHSSMSRMGCSPPMCTRLPEPKCSCGTSRWAAPCCGPALHACILLLQEERQWQRQAASTYEARVAAEHEKLMLATMGEEGMDATVC